MIFEYGTILKQENDPEWFAGREKFTKYEENKIFWEFNIGNGRLSNIEHMTIFLCLFFGFLRLIDLWRTIEYDKTIYKWAYFFEYLENYHNF